MTTLAHTSPDPLATLEADLSAVRSAMGDAGLVLHETVKCPQLSLDIPLLSGFFADLLEAMRRAYGSAENLWGSPKTTPDVHQALIHLDALLPFVKTVITALQEDPTRAELSKVLARYDANLRVLTTPGPSGFLSLPQQRSEGQDAAPMEDIPKFSKKNNVSKREKACLWSHFGKEWGEKNPGKSAMTGLRRRKDPEFSYCVRALRDALANIRRRHHGDH